MAERRSIGRAGLIFCFWCLQKRAQTVFFSGLTNLSKMYECYFEDRWQKDEMAGIQGRRRDGIKTVIKVEKCTFCDGRWNIESVWVTNNYMTKVEKEGKAYIGQQSRARSLEGRGRRDLGPEIWDNGKMTENGNRVLEAVHTGCRSLRSPIVVCRFHPFEE